MVGGYKIIDLKNIPFNSGESVKIEGIFNDINSTEKEIRIANVILDGVGYTTTPVTFRKDETLQGLAMLGDGALVEITKDDTITITIN